MVRAYPETRTTATAQPASWTTTATMHLDALRACPEVSDRRGRIVPSVWRLDDARAHCSWGQTMRRTRRQSRSRRYVGVVVACFVAVAQGCGPAPAPITDGIGAQGFPVGTFTKDREDYVLGRVRIAWTFGPDGRWTEVPFALEGQTLNVPAVRGTYSVDGAILTIATNYPPEWGTSRHVWQMIAGRLWTTFVSSNVPGDAEWFDELDISPWIPVE